MADQNLFELLTNPPEGGSISPAVIIVGVTKIIDQEMSVSELSDALNLTPAQETELEAYVNATEALLIDEVTKYVQRGADQELAVVSVRAQLFARYSQLFWQCQFSQQMPENSPFRLTKQQFDAAFGIEA